MHPELVCCAEVEARWLVTADHGNAEGMVLCGKKGQVTLHSGCLTVGCSVRIGTLAFMLHAQRLTDATNELGGRWMVTADHGDADGMMQRNNKPTTAGSLLRMSSAELACCAEVDRRHERAWGQMAGHGRPRQRRRHGAA